MTGDREDDARYEDFVERYCEAGWAEVPREWSEGLRERCLFFVNAMGGEPGEPPQQSLLQVLASSGVKAELTLTDPTAALSRRLAAGTSGPERYVVERELGRGGMGRVLLAYDRDLRRRIAIKVILRASANPARTSRFLEEAQATAQLEHPNIGPVYDVGVDATGSPFFSMKWIRGRNLDEVLRDAGRDLSLIRLVQILQQAAMGVDFAHSRGVIHRDLKPQNIMVGDYGEVLVMDWGLAKIPHGRVEAREDAVSTDRGDAGVVSLDGAIQGSIPYMAPEQACGEAGAADARTDVFGLGAILYRILAGVPLYPEPDLAAALARARRGDIVSPSRRAPEHEAPPELEEICMKAIALRPGDRFQSAREFHESLQRYIEGIHDAERRSREAARLLDEGRGAHSSLSAALEAAAALGRRRNELSADTADHDPPAKKAPLWALLEEERAAKERAEQRFGDAVAAYKAVLKAEPSNGAARTALSDLYFARLAEAEARGDREAARVYQALVEEHDDGRLAAEIRADFSFSIDSDPPGAAVTLSRYEEKGLILAESAPESIGRTPLARRLAKGSYLATLEKDGFAPVRYPFTLERGASCAARVRLLPPASIPEGFVQVPAGDSIVGGDPEQLSHLPRSRRHVGGLLVASFPVTFQEYLRFLNDHFAARTEAPVPDAPPPWLGLLPSLEAFAKEEYVTREPDGSFRLNPRLHPRMPVMSIPYSAMLEYCAWLGGKLREEVRIPNDIEWERCARGADGRIFPWGNGFDWSFTKGGRSRPGRPFLEPVGSFPEDVSPFGIRDMAGSIREAGPERSKEGFRLCRGGSWYNLYTFVFRSDARTMHREEQRATDLGFRVGFTPSPDRGDRS